MEFLRLFLKFPRAEQMTLWLFCRRYDIMSKKIGKQKPRTLDVKKFPLSYHITEGES